MEPSGVVWALSALGIIMIVISVYFAIFWMLMGAFTWIVMAVLKPIIKIIHG